ncbi:hypothetical protein [Microbispora bryophytorum]|uniref:hypothetical protein n=1 Tax=Microbispora bryophytorum TaxID=1460882 RepID=UPI0033DF6605
MPNGILRWEDPAPRRTPTDEYDPIAAELRANPGRWAVIAENPDTREGRRGTSRVFNAVKNGYRGFRPVKGGTYTATTRTVTKDDGTRVVQVHARFIADA